MGRRRSDAVVGAAEAVRRTLHQEKRFKEAEDISCALRSLSSAKATAAQLHSDAKILREAVITARNTFDEYAETHRAKATCDGDIKAQRNQDLASEMRQALMRTGGPND